jgi:hypothetical protein
VVALAVRLTNDAPGVLDRETETGPLLKLTAQEWAGAISAKA